MKVLSKNGDEATTEIVKESEYYDTNSVVEQTNELINL